MTDFTHVPAPGTTLSNGARVIIAMRLAGGRIVLADCGEDQIERYVVWRADEWWKCYHGRYYKDALDAMSAFTERAKNLRGVMG